MTADDPENDPVRVGLPLFIYHPDPLSTGSIIVSDKRCVACQQERGFIYAASAYAEQDLDGKICPWCIADGSAAARFGATYSDDCSLVRAGLPEAVIEEVTRRTPGYFSWQGEDWQTCCGDACTFLGDAGRDHLLALDPVATEQFLSRTGWSPEEWKSFVSDVYAPGGSPAIYRFACRHCSQSRYGWDCD